MFKKKKLIILLDFNTFCRYLVKDGKLGDLLNEFVGENCFIIFADNLKEPIIIKEIKC